MAGDGHERAGRASTRVVVAAVVGVAVAVLTGLAAGWGYAASAGCVAAGIVFLVWTWVVIAGMDAAQTRAHATAEDPSRRLTLLLVLGASVASLAGVGYLLVQASSEKGGVQGLAAGLGVVSVAVSWLVVHTLFTLRYARACQMVCGAPRGADVPSGGERTPRLACRGRSVKLAAA